ncbi:hypothetical protein [Patulibacter sp. SYSU D01012]|uniref:hypothetical protein n=1 Tax=Patulibacter sp. SYSU D01012 TaxID=2817381 RepID=UPI001B304C73|nr:hypothetical protein [Patulibacter sp. SYSU D01012]
MTWPRVDPLRPYRGAAIVPPLAPRVPRVERVVRDDAPRPFDPPPARRSGERVVVGGTLAALVAADALGAAGVPVRLLAPTHDLAGALLPARREGRTLLPPPRLLRLDGAGVGVWAAGVLGTTPAVLDDAATVEAGRLEPDVLLHPGDPRPYARLPEAVRDELRREVHAVRAAFGDDGLLDADHEDALAGMTLAEASVGQHGPAFHRRWVGPRAAKAAPGGARSIAAALRHAAWTPLVRPATLAAALDPDEALAGVEAPPHTLAPELVGVLVERLVARLRSRASVVVEVVGGLRRVGPGGGGGTALEFLAGPPVTAWRPLLAIGAGELFPAAGVPYDVPRLRAVTAWVEGDAAALAEVPQLTHVLDPAVPVVRVAPGGVPLGPGRTLLVVELRAFVEDAAIARTAVEGLRDAGLAARDAPLASVLNAARPAHPAPTPALLEAYGRARAAYDALGLDATLAAGARGPACGALAAQVQQGLAAAAVVA